MRALTLLPLVLFGCEVGSADRDDTTQSTALEGRYSVTDAQRSSGSCDGPMEATTLDYDEFVVQFQDVFGFEVLALSPCNASGDCDGGLFGSVYFETWDDDVAVGSADVTSHAGGECFFSWTTNELVSTADGVSYTVTRAEVSGVPGVDLDDCIEQQENWTDPRPCVEVETVSATAI